MSEALEILFGAEPAKSLQVAEALRDLILGLIPSATEKVRVGWGLLGFDAPGFFAFISPHQKKVRLGFLRGPLLDDPLGLLEGQGTYVRWVTCATLADASRKGLAPLISQAFSAQLAAKRAARRKGAPPRTR